MESIYFARSMPRIISTLALKKTWGGAVFAPSAPVRYKTLPTPTLPGDEHVVVKNTQCGICASDLHLVYVSLDPMVHPAALPSDDRIFLGHEVVSHVAQAGRKSVYKEGDRVAMMSRFLGQHCRTQGIDPLCPACVKGDYCLCHNRSLGQHKPGVGGGWSHAYSAHDAELWRVPDALDDDQATMIEPIACGVRAALRVRPKPGENVLVVGCGTIGLGTIQAIRALFPDVNVFARARHPQQRKLAASYGAKLVDGDLFEATAELTGAHIYQGDFGNRTLEGGFDAVFDCVASAKTTGDALRMVRGGGTVIQVGVNLTPVKLDLTPIVMQEVNLLGSMAHGGEVWDGEEMSTFDLCAQLMLDGKLSIEGMITHRFPLSEWKKAIQTSSDKTTGCVKVLFEC